MVDIRGQATDAFVGGASNYNSPATSQTPGDLEDDHDHNDDDARDTNKQTDF